MTKKIFVTTKMEKIAQGCDRTYNLITYCLKNTKIKCGMWVITIQNPAVALAGNVKEVKQVTRYIIGGSTLAQYHQD